MADRLLATRLYVPRARRTLVSRERLLSRLDAINDARLCLISAPPGFGKTTLLADWIATHAGRHNVAWLSIEAADSDPVTFWTDVIAAVQSVAPVAGVDAAASLRAQPAPTLEPVLTSLLNDLGDHPADLVLVLDDYHAITAPAVHEGLAFFIDHLPSNVHLAISSRADPPLPLARLRARGELIEVRAADLRFLPGETEAYLNDAMHLALSERDLALLEERTEGWVAALQLAAISLQDRTNTGGFIERFAGDDRYVVDYLVEEVLQRQPADVRHFLLATSLLDRLSGPLCDAVTGSSDGEARLRSLEQQNLFIVPLDDHRTWYRYHHLFADVLRAHLAAEQPERLHEVHRRASRWFAGQRETAAAIHHALAAGEFGRAAGLVETVLQEVLRARQEPLLRSWIEALPRDLLAQRPVVGAGYVGVLLQTGEIALLDGLLNDAEAALASAAPVDIDDEAPAGRPVFVDHAEFEALPGMIALYRAACAQIGGNVEDTERYARLALERMAPGGPLRGGAMALLGLALWRQGKLEEASETYARGMELVHGRGYVNDSSTLMMADLLVARGELEQARQLYERSIRTAAEQGTALPRGIADQHVGLSEVLREMGDLAGAAEHLATSQALGEAASLPENRYRWFTAMAGLRQSEGDAAAAIDLLDEAARHFAPGFSPDVRPIAALRARASIVLGHLDAAERWAREHAVAVDDELSYLREFEHITLARLLLARARNEPPGAPAGSLLRLLDRLAASAAAGGRRGALVEILVLEALAVDRVQGEPRAALELLQEALRIAEPLHYIQVFLDEGAPLVELLALADQRQPGGYAGRLVALAAPDGRGEARAPASEHNLSERELEVLRLLATDLSGPEIANELVVSLNTLRTHTKNIYTKLGVTTRRAAVRRAGELHLL